MSSNSNQRVTITLGRSGQVVTKEGKRPPGEGSWMSSSKRHRGDRMKWSLDLSGEKGSRIASNDLRLKLIRKRQLKRSHDVVKYRQKIEVHRASSRSSEAPMNYRTLPSRPSSSSHYSDLRPTTYPEQYASESEIAYSSQFMTRGSRRPRPPDRISRPTRELSPPRISSQTQQMLPLGTVDLPSGSLVQNAGAQNAPPPRSWLTGSSPRTTIKHAPLETSGAAVPRAGQTLGTLQQISQKYLYAA